MQTSPHRLQALSNEGIPYLKGFDSHKEKEMFGNVVGCTMVSLLVHLERTRRGTCFCLQKFFADAVVDVLIL